MPDQCYYLLVNMKLVWVIILMYYIKWGDFPGGPAVKNPPCNAGDVVQSLVRELGPTCMPQLRVHMSQLRSLPAATKEPMCGN